MRRAVGGRAESERFGLAWSLAISLLALVSAIPFALLDFDAHHDGLMATAAVAVRDGYRIHAEVFSQYGPVTSWLQGLAATLISQPAVAIRILNVVAIAITAFAVAELGRRMPRAWPVSRSASRWAAFSWIVVADYFLWVPMLPWSSVLAVAMASVALLLIMRGLARPAHESSSSDASAFGPAWSVHRRWPLAGLADHDLEH